MAQQSVHILTGFEPRTLRHLVTDLKDARDQLEKTIADHCLEFSTMTGFRVGEIDISARVDEEIVAYDVAISLTLPGKR